VCSRRARQAREGNRPADRFALARMARRVSRARLGTKCTSRSVGCNRRAIMRLNIMQQD